MSPVAINEIIFAITGVLMIVWMTIIALISKSSAKPSSAVEARISREQQEDEAIDRLEERFVNDEITMEELAEETEYILKGESNEQRRLRYEHGIVPWSQRPTGGGDIPPPTRVVGEIQSALFEYDRELRRIAPPKPSDSAHAVRTYSYPAAPGWPDVDPPRPVNCALCGGAQTSSHYYADVNHPPTCEKCWRNRQSYGSAAKSDPSYICMKDAAITGDCACPDCMPGLSHNERRERMGFAA